MSEPTLKLQRGGDELLKDFPLSEPDFEAQAKAIEARLRGDASVGDPGALLPPSAGMTVDDLFKTPTLTAEPGEPGTAAPAASSVRAAEAPKSNFAEMARKSVQKKDDDSTQMARELMAATAQSRRPSAEMVERVRAAGRAVPTETPLPHSEPSVEEPQRTSGVVARAAAPQPASNNRGTLIGIAGGVLALAACVALFVQSGQSESSRTSDALAAQKASDTNGASKAAPAAPVDNKASEGVVSPETLAAAPAAAAQAEAKSGAKAPAVGAAAPKGAPAAGGAAKPEAVVLEDDAAPAAADKPGSAPPAAAKPEEPVLKPAEGHSGGVPLTPSAGAVSAALGAVRGGAQQCLAGQTVPVTAMVTFASNGHVLRVGANGPAAACIQAALSKAHIQPFAKESFSASTTIRPP